MYISVVRIIPRRLLFGRLARTKPFERVERVVEKPIFTHSPSSKRLNVIPFIPTAVPVRSSSMSPSPGATLHVADHGVSREASLLRRVAVPFLPCVTAAVSDVSEATDLGSVFIDCVRRTFNANAISHLQPPDSTGSP